MWFFGGANDTVATAVHTAASSMIEFANATVVPPVNASTDGDLSGFYLLKLLALAVNDQLNYMNRLGFQWSRVLGVSRYCCLIYGVTCLLMALILNRTYVMALTNNTVNQAAALQQRRAREHADDDVPPEVLRQAPAFSWCQGRTLVEWGSRLVAITTLLVNTYHVLVALNLFGHTNRDRPYWWLPDRYFAYDSDKFANVSLMRTPEDQVMVGPTTDMYFSVFLSFCLSLFVETMLLVLADKKPYTELGITIFEHLFAFQEFSSNGALIFGGSSGTHYRRPTEEVLVLALFSLVNHLNIHFGGLINGNKYRLIPLSIAGLSFLAYFLRKLLLGQILRFPFILMVTFLPQIIIISLVIICAMIFALAVLANGGKIDNLNYALFLLVKDENGESPAFDIHWHDDFYTALLNLGMLAISLAGKLSYITELLLVNMDDATWLDRTVWQNLQMFANRSLVLADDPKLISKSRGYANLVAAPTKRMIMAGTSSEGGNPHDESEDIAGVRRQSIQGRRFYLVGQIISLFFDLVSSLAKQRVSRKKHVPKFLELALKSPDEPQRILVNTDDLTVEEIEERYRLLVFGDQLADIDTSPDYHDEDDDEDYSESDHEEDFIGVFSEVVYPDSFEEFSTPVMLSHMQHGRITRSAYQSMTSLARSVGSTNDETERFILLLLEQRLKPKPQDHTSLRLDCVICQVNPREIITWPCKCFAICEGCRLALVSKGMEGCVCCRREVGGVSKVFIP